MKKVLIYFFIFITNVIFAAPVGNPLNPEIIDEGFFISPVSWVNFRLGYEGIFVSDARMDKELEKGKIDNFKNDINSGSITLNIKNRIDMFGILGASRIRSDWRFINSGVMSRIEIESKYKFYWATGTKIILFQWHNTALSAGGRYSCTKPTLSFITSDGIPHDTTDGQIRFKDWQVDMGIAHEIDIFIPYVGVKYSRAKAKIINSPITIAMNSQNFLKMKNRDRFGVYAGCSLSNSKYFMLTIEARFLDEEAISVVGEMKF
jgi:hypothetical protein